MTTFRSFSFVEQIMTAGDAQDYLRAVGDLEAMQRVAFRRPWAAKSLRTAMKTKAREIATLEARYT